MSHYVPLRKRTQLHDEDQIFLREMADQIKKIAPEVLEIWLHGSSASGNFNVGNKLGFIAFLPPPVTPSRRLDLRAAGKKVGFSDLVFLAAKKVHVRPTGVTHTTQQARGVAFFVRIEGEGFKVWSAIGGMVCRHQIGQKPKGKTLNRSNGLHFWLRVLDIRLRLGETIERIHAPRCAEMRRE
jgi:hypothetical protein